MTQVALIIGAADRQCPKQELLFARAQRSREQDEVPAHARAYLKAFDALLKARGGDVAGAVQRMRLLAPNGAGRPRCPAGLDGLLPNLEEYR